MSDEDKAMQLPDGKTCADCVHVRRCVAFGFSWLTRTQCDFFPSSYMPRTTPYATARTQRDMVLNQDARSE